MLKVVGASWLQTRISTYIIGAFALLGIGAIILGEYGLMNVENDGTYSATVSWNHKGGYRIDFWGQGNDLANVRLNAARAYYKTDIFEIGWSIIEIETSSKYPDTVQAYAAGLLEGSLTWQIIYHHWHNTVNAVCEKWADECQKLMRFLHENTAIVRERAERLAAMDPFWHMVRLFYVQLDGLEAGWKFAVRRSRQTVEMSKEHFLWLAMAADLPDLERTLNGSYNEYIKGMIFVKSSFREGQKGPLIAIGHTTVAPYAKMLRLLKRYTFGYHVLPVSKNSASVPGGSIVMSSYPGALSSHDEFYLIQGENRELIVAGTPLTVSNRSLWNFMSEKDQVMSSARVMAANRLAMNEQSWSRSMSLQNGADVARLWVTLEPRDGIVCLVEQLPGLIRPTDISKKIINSDVLWAISETQLSEINVAIGENEVEEEEEKKEEDDDETKNELVTRLQSNITTAKNFRKLMQDYSHEKFINEDEDQSRILTKRGNREKIDLPFGIIDTKTVLANADGVESFEAISGPIVLDSTQPFQWSTTFPNVSHIGQPDIFNFDSVTPLWVWL
ncbi:putative phospholipase B-like lamina ancestor [Monomorium pharaonis]|uniref:putative phospholipase B-like lamina ancestor n=1 Tax=Monomorium pharaonis TaxID=307658 RepID=UPI0017471DB9|nr:putative phospholipase B-like lamina ancestor [Monomorium pharaonis]XP_036149337.1 putative phospholipase B-like lamina ancestor [Monomorium pharaonis]